MTTQDPSAAAPAADSQAQQATTKPADAGSSGAGADDIEAIKRQNAALLSDLTKKKGELAETKQKLDTYTSEAEARQAEELKTKGEFEKLWNAEKQEKESVKSQLIRAELRAFAAQEGIIDIDVIDLIPKEKVKLNDQHQVSGAEDAVKAFKASKPHFFKNPAAAAAGAAAGAAQAGKATGAAVVPPGQATATQRITDGVKPNSPEARKIIDDYLANAGK